MRNTGHYTRVNRQNPCQLAEIPPKLQNTTANKWPHPVHRLACAYASAAKQPGGSSTMARLPSRMSGTNHAGTALASKRRASRSGSCASGPYCATHALHGTAHSREQQGSQAAEFACGRRLALLGVVMAQPRCQCCRDRAAKAAASAAESPQQPQHIKW